MFEGSDHAANVNRQLTVVKLRDDINATIGFETLGRAVDTPPKSLMRMFGRRGNPNARNLLAVIGHLQRASGIELRVEARK